MADEATTRRPAQGTQGTPPHDAPETSVGRRSAVGIEMGNPDQEGKNPMHREPDHGLGVEIDGNDASVTRTDSSEPGKAVKVGEDGRPIPPADTEEKPADETTTADTTGVALPAFDPTKPEAVQAYEKQYVAADGKFNMAALSADWQKNAKMDPKTGDFTGGLSEDTYKYLESKGWDRATVKAVEAGQVAQIKLTRQAVFDAAGGQEKYGQAVEWARKGGLDAATIKKFNADLDAGGQSQKDAVELLMARFTKAVPPSRRASPQRTTADAASNTGEDNSGVKPYTNYQEYQADLRKAKKENNQALLNQSRARLKASPFYTGS